MWHETKDNRGKEFPGQGAGEAAEQSAPRPRRSRDPCLPFQVSAISYFVVLVSFLNPPLSLSRNVSFVGVVPPMNLI